MGNASHGVLERLRLDPRFKFGYYYPLLLEAMIDLTHGTAEFPERAEVTKEFGISRDPDLIKALVKMADELHATVDVVSAVRNFNSPVYWSSGAPGSALDGSIEAAIEHIYHRGETPIIAIRHADTQPIGRIHVHLT